MLGCRGITRVQSTNQKLTASETPHRHDLSLLVVSYSPNIWRAFEKLLFSKIINNN